MACGLLPVLAVAVLSLGTFCDADIPCSSLFCPPADNPSLVECCHRRNETFFPARIEYKCCLPKSTELFKGWLIIALIITAFVVLSGIFCCCFFCTCCPLFRQRHGGATYVLVNTAPKVNYQALPQTTTAHQGNPTASSHS
ncbi:uncharacterized protein LOC135810853 [Sycon ciliatum]|uniref:uncharacterized protein LOC135810853 n=1 Tax=Sycon ciliatum TaxID=27933 RepID=UPI0031F71FB5